ncbi:GntR family transcriptional regulator [Lactobacillus sp. ESL0791]|uniref:GntR family transcriptional regulator n=1 Tax=Lactobacillus sp. ESL0791 TaxID=2983234 RepID=UPI0023F95B58|nr:GntR family transcriptional regulator [Lactobacillus sp. ESL0791]MDF7639854.1 GntR family transcriptional regulator [Lactobacillus sp. ESL0791]
MSLQENAYSYLKKEILAHHFDYQKVYSATKIANQLSISRTPFRNALQNLSQEKYIDIIPNKGFMLHRLTEKEVIEMYEVRSAIESYSAYYLLQNQQQNFAKDITSKLKKSLLKQAKIIEKDDITFSKEDFNFHRILVSSTKNQVFIDLHNRYSYMIKLLAINAYKNSNRKKEVIAEHQQIYDAIMSKDATLTLTSVLDHINSPKNLDLKTIRHQINI